MNQAQLVHIFFVEPPTEQEDIAKIVMKGSLSFAPHFEKGQGISLNDISDDSTPVAISVNSDKHVTHYIVKTEWSFNTIDDVLIPSLIVVVKRVERKKEHILFPPSFA